MVGCKRIGCRVTVLAVVVAAIVGTMAYKQFYGASLQLDAEFYRAGRPSPKEPFSYQDYAQTLKEFVDQRGMVNYAGLKKKREALDNFVRALAAVGAKTYQSWDQPSKIAFWINAYNALTLKAIIDNYPIKPSLLKSLAYPKNSIRQIPGVWDKQPYLVLGKKMTLNQIEHETLRAKFSEPRIHLALVCAALGCPPLRNEPYEAARLQRQLDDQGKKFFSDPAKFRIDQSGKKVRLSQIFKWFGKDFVDKYEPGEGFAQGSQAERSVLHFAGKYVTDNEGKFLQNGKYRIEYVDYDWSLNEQKPSKDQKRPSKK